MPSVIFPGPEGRLEGRYSPGPRPRAPVAMILHPHPHGGGTMNDRMVQRLYKTFVDRGFATLRFNFRGVGRSQGSFDNGVGELSDAASALDWVQSIHPEAQTTWVAGVSFGALIGMQLLMRRPEVRGFISVSAPANHPPRRDPAGEPLLRKRDRRHDEVGRQLSRFPPLARLPHPLND
jgi:alpha/beta superfamily hydrolase